MRHTKAKKLATEIAIALYGEHAAEGKFSSEDMRDIRKDYTFRAVYRAKKKNVLAAGSSKNIKPQVSTEDTRRNNAPYKIFGTGRMPRNNNFLGNSAGNHLHVVGTFKFRRHVQVSNGPGIDGKIHRINHYIPVK